MGKIQGDGNSWSFLGHKYHNLNEVHYILISDIYSQFSNYSQNLQHQDQGPVTFVKGRGNHTFILSRTALCQSIANLATMCI